MSEVMEKWVEASKVPQTLINVYEHRESGTVNVKQSGSNGTSVFTAAVMTKILPSEEAHVSSSKRTFLECWRPPEHSGCVEYIQCFRFTLNYDKVLFVHAELF